MEDSTYSYGAICTALAVVGYFLLWKAYHIVWASPVSMPGGPRAHKEFRKPTFEPKRTFKTKSKGEWVFLSDHASHEASTAECGGIELTGESAGRATWVFREGKSNNIEESFDPSINPNSADKIFRKQMIDSWKGKKPDVKTRPKTASEAAKKGVEFYQMLQCSEGHWSGDYGGPLFLMPGLIITCYVSGKMAEILGIHRQEAMIKYLRYHQQSDGGWGTHLESPSTMFGSVLNYVALRLLGVDSSDMACVKGREFIKTNGGALYTSSWAKFWLCCLGVFNWEGVNSIPVEMWLLPQWFPFHPSKMWCHSRMVYLPMGYLYGRRFSPSVEDDPLLLSLRHELFVEKYDTIKWNQTRHLVSPYDNYSNVHWIMKCAHWILSFYEKSPIQYLRQKGLDFAFEYIEAEDLQTNFVDIGPVNKAANMMCVFAARGADCEQFKQHITRVADYLWIAEDGMKMQGYNGSQCWDTSFAIQAVIEADLADDFKPMVKKVYSFMERAQILSTPISQASPAFIYESPMNRIKYFRHVSKGGWPFSTPAHGWPISDCTGEALKSVLQLRKINFIKEDSKTCLYMNDERFYDAVNVILTLQNDDGGWATYENMRGGGWFENLNPSEVFADIMIDYSYVECSTASLTALVEFQEQFPTHRRKEVSRSIRRGTNFLSTIQRDDGSWYGSWGCCFTYGCWFGIEGLIAGGYKPTNISVKKAVKFLLSHQNENGGWGEDFSSCYDRSYAHNGAEMYGVGKSGVIQTSWALLGLMAADGSHQNNDYYEAIHRGIQFLMMRQENTGDWEQEGIAGVFNRACGITYTAYRNVFPIWALGRYATRFQQN